MNKKLLSFFMLCAATGSLQAMQASPIKALLVTFVPIVDPIKMERYLQELISVSEDDSDVDTPADLHTALLARRCFLSPPSQPTDPSQVVEWGPRKALGNTFGPEGLIEILGKTNAACSKILLLWQNTPLTEFPIDVIKEPQPVLTHEGSGFVLSSQLVYHTCDNLLQEIASE